MPYPRNGKYYSDIRLRDGRGLPTGERVRKLLPGATSMREARKAEAALARQLLYGEKHIPLVSDFLTTTYMQWARDNKKRADCDDRHVRFLSASKSLAGLRLDEVSLFQIESLKREIMATPNDWGKPRRAGDANNKLAVLSRAFRLAGESGLIKGNPVRLVKWFDPDTKPFSVLSREDEPKLWLECGRGPAYLLPLAKLAVLTGMREGEMLRLRKSDINFGRSLLYVRRPKSKKDKRRTEGLPLSPEALSFLQMLCARTQGELLFERGDGRVIPTTTASSAFLRAAARAGLAGLTFHHLRHTFGTRLGEAGYSAHEIAHLMGHADINSTNLYVHTAHDRLRQAAGAATGHWADTRGSQ